MAGTLLLPDRFWKGLNQPVSAFDQRNNRVMCRTFTQRGRHSVWLREISDVSPIDTRAFKYKTSNLVTVTRK
jgi:hypothetical protein